jgi:class 3 adenylate cyclase
VNVAARVQDATRELGEPLLLTEAARCLLDQTHTPLTAHGSLSLRGKSEPVAIYGLASRNASRTALA